VSPCLSLDRAYRVAAAGQTVQLAAGTYSGGDVNADGSKTSSADVVFKPVAGATVTLNGEVDVRASHVTFEGVKFAEGWKTHREADDVTFLNVSSRHLFIWSSSNVSVIGGDIGTFGARVSYDSNITEYPGSQVAPRNILIDGVYFHDWIDVDSGQANHIECLQVGAGVNVTVRNSRFERCGTHDIFIRSWGSINGGIHELRNWTIENNFFGETEDGYYAIQFVNDLGFSNADLLVRNNSFLQGISMDDPSTTVTVDSNIFSEQATYGCSADVYRYNIDEELLGTGGPCGNTDRVAAVQYVNRGALDLHLSPGSPGIDEGNPSSSPSTDYDGQSRPRGGRADVGADEF
jgi:hypothetical protein